MANKDVCYAYYIDVILNTGDNKQPLYPVKVGFSTGVGMRFKNAKNAWNTKSFVELGIKLQLPLLKEINAIVDNNQMPEHLGHLMFILPADEQLETTLRYLIGGVTISATTILNMFPKSIDNSTKGNIGSKEFVACTKERIIEIQTAFKQNRLSISRVDIFLLHSTLDDVEISKRERERKAVGGTRKVDLSKCSFLDDTTSLTRKKIGTEIVLRIEESTDELSESFTKLNV